ncbi:hypothetical protein SLA2020_018270 [Shorea laevis]
MVSDEADLGFLKHCKLCCPAHNCCKQAAKKGKLKVRRNGWVKLAMFKKKKYYQVATTTTDLKWDQGWEPVGE